MPADRLRSTTKISIEERRACGNRSLSIRSSSPGAFGRGRPSGCFGRFLRGMSPNHSTISTPRPSACQSTVYLSSSWSLTASHTFLYVAISRARDRAELVTDDAWRLNRAVFEQSGVDALKPSSALSPELARRSSVNAKVPEGSTENLCGNGRALETIEAATGERIAALDAIGTEHNRANARMPETGEEPRRGADREAEAAIERERRPEPDLGQARTPGGVERGMDL